MAICRQEPVKLKEKLEDIINFAEIKRIMYQFLGDIGFLANTIRILNPL
jgi:hypothetical protein